jgi:type II restriction/modification system DNA methylase subunit YeeA
MSALAFAEKWQGVRTGERAAAQEHFIDVCALVGVETPNAADPAGNWYAFEKGAQKVGGGDGFADVWKKDHFAWEYKGKRKSLVDAYQQLLQYREALENPPLLVVCDLDRFEVHTNFTGTAKKVHAFDLEDLRKRPEAALKVLRSVMLSPDDLKPDVTTEQVTEEVATKFAALASSLQSRGHDPFEVARFLNRLLFCFFAEDARLLPPGVVSKILAAAGKNTLKVTSLLRELFGKMAKKGGGFFGTDEIQWFNGGLFRDDATVPLREEDLQILREAAHVDWSAVEPAILGTLFERAMDPNKRSQLGAHYTDKISIMSVIEPVIMMPLRREFEQVRARVNRLIARGKRATTAAKGRENPNRIFRGFLDRLRSLRILDPACGSGNFLYLALRAVKDLEKEAIVWGSGALGLSQEIPLVGPQITLGIEFNAYAAELARVSIWIGEIQWMLANGFDYQRNPILRPLETIENRDAILVDTGSNATEATWPNADFVVGNPPFLGGKLLRRTLGDEYVDSLFAVFKGRVPAESDYVCYWFEKARAAIHLGKTRRAGLLATQGIRGGKNRAVLDKIKAGGDIFLAWSDREWVVDGAEVHVSIVGFDDGSEKQRTRDGNAATAINSDLTVGIDLTKAPALQENAGIAFMGDTKGGDFDISDEEARKMLGKHNPHGKPNSDVIVRWVNGALVTKRPKPMWIIDFGTDMKQGDAALYEAPFEFVKRVIQPQRKESLTTIDQWWLHERPRVEMRTALAGLARFICTVRHAKHRIFFWVPRGTLPDSALIVFARDDDYTFGVLQSRVHSLWSLAKGTQVREKETGFRYTPTSTFETFPFPDVTSAQNAAISVAAERLNRLREGWLHPKGGTTSVDRLTLTELYTNSPVWLQHAHAELDRVVMAAYGWPDNISGEQILERLLRLNKERSGRSKAA